MEIEEISAASSVSVNEECLSISVESVNLLSAASTDGLSELSAETSSGSVCVETAPGSTAPGSTALGSFPECIGPVAMKETKKRARGGYNN